MAKIKVNILNKGKLFGVVTPVYGLTIDYELYVLYKQMGFVIEPYKEPEKLKDVVPVKEEVKEEIVEPEENIKTVDNAEELEDKIDKEIEKAIENAPKEEVKETESIFNYTKEELEQKTKLELIGILNSRGYFSKRTGKAKRDPNMPSILDNKDDLIRKVLNTNK